MLSLAGAIHHDQTRAAPGELLVLQRLCPQTLAAALQGRDAIEPSEA